MKKIILFYITICLSLPLACMEPTAQERKLFEAIRHGNIKEVEKLIEAGLDVDIVRKYQEKVQSPIEFALEQEQNEIILLLHTAIQKLTENKFIAALNTGDIKTIQKLSNEVDKNIIYNVLKTAIIKNDTPVIQVLINKAELEDIQEALRLAINTKNLQTVKTVLDSTLHINIDEINDDRETPLILAIKTHDINIIKAILAEVPDPDKKYREALKLSKTEQEKELMKIAEAQFNLVHAIQESRSDLQSFITPEALNLNILSTTRNPLAAAIDKNNLNAVKLLIGEGKKINPDFVNQRLKGNITPLLLAVSLNRLDIVKFLLENGANPNIPPDIFFNDTPLLVAIKNNNTKITNLLLENEKNKANINYQTPSDNITLLMLAATQADVNAVKKLLELGANPSMQNSEGKTALDLVQELYDNISDEDIKDPDWADMKNSYAEIITLLKEKMPIILSTNQPLIQLLHKFTQSLQALIPKLKK